MQYNLQFDKLCSKLELGEIIGTSRAISGGLLHRMYAIETNKGKYAIKALNPRIMHRPPAMGHFIASEEIAKALKDIIPAIPARRFNNSAVQQLDGQYYLVFDWVEGNSLKISEIEKQHCIEIGKLLALIHRADLSSLGINCEDIEEKPVINWSYFIKKGLEEGSIWAEELGRLIDNLYAWNAKANEAEKILATNLVISHRDLDPKNVLWNSSNPIIIDWESAGYTNPSSELLEVAIYWSETKDGNIDREKLMGLIESYKANYGAVEINWRVALESGFSGKLGWLEYNLKRSLLIECTDSKEQELGTTQVIGTLADIKNYAEKIKVIESWFR